MHLETIIYSFLISMCLLSCHSQERSLDVIENSKRLERQNRLALGQKVRSEGFLDQVIFEDYTAEKYEYLQPLLKHYNESADLFLDVISKDIDPINIKDEARLFNNHQALQQVYKKLKQKINDSFDFIKFDTCVDAFMNLDEQSFTRKYINDKNSVKGKFQLLALQADAIWAETLFTEIILTFLSPNSSTFDFHMGMATTDKIVYKKGDRIKVNAFIARRYDLNIQNVTINGKKVEKEKESQEYWVKAKGASGLHQLNIILSAWINGREAVYPATVWYKVE